MNNVKVYASAGLLLIAVAHAAVLGLILSSNQAETARQNRPILPPAETQFIQPADYPQMSGPSNRINPTDALHENKQGGGVTRIYNPNTGEHVRVPNQFVSPKTTPQGIPQSILENKTQGVRSQAGPCFPCQQPQIVQQPYYVAPYTYTQPYTPTPSPAPTPLAMPRPSNKPHKLALFVNGSQKSNAVLQWFSRNPELAALKNFCEFQLYSPNDTLYRTRYAQIVPVDAMPAVIWMYQPPGDVDGKQAAQVAAVGGADISNDAQLVADLRKGYAFFQDVKNSTASQPSMYPYQLQPARSESQFWGQFAAPTLLLNQASMDDGYGNNPPCVGPNCPTPNQPPLLQPDDGGRDWRPFDGRRPDATGPVLDLARMPQETLIAMVLVIAGALIAYGILQFRK